MTPAEICIVKAYNKREKAKYPKSFMKTWDDNIANEVAKECGISYTRVMKVLWF